MILYLYFAPLLWPWCIYASPNARTWHPLRKITRFSDLYLSAFEPRPSLRTSFMDDAVASWQI